MDKKTEILLEMLTNLKPYWNEAEKFIQAIQNNELNEESRDKLYDIIMKEVKNINDEKLQGQFKESMNAMEAIRAKEAQEREKEEEELDDLEKMIDNI